MDATYILGTDEYVVLELTDVPDDFTSSEWGAEMALLDVDDTWDPDDVTDDPWVAATFGTSEDGNDTVKALISDLLDEAAAGTYKSLVRLTKTVGGTEIPVLRASGRVVIEEA